MSIRNVTEMEIALTLQLQRMTEALQATTAERDALQKQLKDKQAHLDALAVWLADGDALLAKEGFSVLFKLGVWWADRPWRAK